MKLALAVLLLSGCSPAPPERDVSHEMATARIDTLVERANRLEARIAALEAKAPN